jgi:hypothetical protein
MWCVTDSGAVAVWTFPTLEPVLVNNGSFVLDRVLDRPGDVAVRVGDAVQPETIVARSESVEKVTTIFVAAELGVAANSVPRHLAKPIGSRFSAGEVIARARPGLRAVTVTAPAAGTVLSVDESQGTVQFAVSSGHRELRALVTGEVERVVPDHGAVIRATGDRIFGILGFGKEAIGSLLIGADRADRELTPDQVKDAWKGRIVVGGMTAGVPALNKLRQVGVAGLIVGSLSEADIRRFLSTGATSGEARAGQFWASSHPAAPFASAADDAPFVIVATEGFGRIPMAEALFSFLRERNDVQTSIQATTCVGDYLRRPEIYLAGESSTDGSRSRASDDVLPERPVRLVGGRYLGTVATCDSEAFEQVTTNGLVTNVARVRMPSGEVRIVPVTNLEVLQ